MRPRTTKGSLLPDQRRRPLRCGYQSMRNTKKRVYHQARGRYHPSTSLRKDGKCECCQLVDTISSYKMGALQLNSVSAWLMGEGAQ